MQRKHYLVVLAAVIPTLIVVAVGVIRAKIEIENGTLTGPVAIASMIIMILITVAIVWGVNVNIARYKHAARRMQSSTVHVWLCMLEGGKYCRLLSVDDKHVAVWKLRAKTLKLVSQWDKANITIRQDRISLASGIPLEGLNIYVGNELQQGAVLYDPGRGRGMLMYPLKGTELSKAIAVLQSAFTKG